RHLYRDAAVEGAAAILQQLDLSETQQTRRDPHRSRRQTRREGDRSPGAASEGSAQLARDEGAEVVCGKLLLQRMAMRIMIKIGLGRRQSVKTGHGHMLEPARSAAPGEDHRSGRAARR